MNLFQWLDHIQSLHVSDMDLSLERVKTVAERLEVLQPNATVITVGGTNGKGSTVAGLEAIYCAAGYRVGAFTSPILYRHNEYIRIQGIDIDDTLFCDAFARIDIARGDISLTPFEFNALAAFIVFQQAHLDIWILEVGLGGRFDAVNVVDTDVAVVTSIGIDHVEWLGDTREKIAYEKAGIFRRNKPVVCGDIDPPVTLMDYAKFLPAIVYRQNKEFRFKKNKLSWEWQSQKKRLTDLPLPALALCNMSTVLMVVELLQEKWRVSDEAIRKGLSNVKLTGRIQVLPGKIMQVVDVSHNPESVKFFAEWLREHSVKGKTYAVFSMLTDKDIVGTIQEIKELIDDWHVASLPVKRAASLEQLVSCLQQAEQKNVYTYDSIKAAHSAAYAKAGQEDRVIVFGSFSTVSSVVA